jgi:hypothetical protein
METRAVQEGTRMVSDGRDSISFHLHSTLQCFARRHFYTDRTSGAAVLFARYTDTRSAILPQNRKIR